MAEPAVKNYRSYLQVESLTKSFGDLLLFENISFSVSEGQRVGLIARNGAGKTTLLNIIAGKEDYASGNIVFRRDLRVAFLEQNPQLSPELTVLEACFQGDSQTVKAISEYENALLSEDQTVIQEAMGRMESLGAWDYESRAKLILSQLKIDDFNKPVGQLSGGQLKRVALAGVLISEPDILLLDEPTNHLDLEMIQWLEEYLRRAPITLLMVTHDRYFLDRVCSDILEIDERKVFQYHGNYSLYLEKRNQRLEAAVAQRESDINLYRKELEWMRRQPQARATKAKARIESFYDLEDRLRKERDSGKLQLNVKSGYIGKKIFEAQKISKAYGDLTILKDFSYTFSRYEKMGIVGKNGTGKSTFIKILMGEVQPDSGKIDVGETIRFGYYSQDGLDFDDNDKVLDVVTAIAESIETGNGKHMTASQFLQYFLFPPAVQHNFVSKLSGGEKRRLYLCTVLMKNPNFLVLDEPTNDLDIMTLQVLEDYLQSFSGCLIVVSHDRYFMDKVVDHLLVFNGNGDIKDFPGNYTQYIDWLELKKLQESESASASREAKPKYEKSRSDNKRKLSYAESKELERIWNEIPLLEAEKNTIESEMSSGTLSMETLNNKSIRIAELITLIDEKTMHWLELSEIES